MSNLSVTGSTTVTATTSRSVQLTTVTMASSGSGSTAQIASQIFTTTAAASATVPASALELFGAFQNLSADEQRQANRLMQAPSPAASAFSIEEETDGDAELTPRAQPSTAVAAAAAAVSRAVQPSFPDEYKYGKYDPGSHNETGGAHFPDDQTLSEGQRAAGGVEPIRDISIGKAKQPPKSGNCSCSSSSNCTVM